MNSALGNTNALGDAKLCAKEIFKLISTVAEISDTAEKKNLFVALLLRIKVALSAATLNST
ncbi:MAG: hypothetical protein IJQ85_04880 [Selenomonadaceae bacterium]|nr:hypothetical protein [Selenomonadaceae bacterium]